MLRCLNEPDGTAVSLHRAWRDASSWIFYFNNNPLIAGAGHPVVDRCAFRSDRWLLSELLRVSYQKSNQLPDPAI